MVKGSLQIHTENILPIIKKWLYSDRDIFMRELVSNSCDAIRKLTILQEKGEAPPRGDHPFQIDVTMSASTQTITFADNGIGMTAEEVEKYIAQIAFSGAEEFLTRYQSEEKEPFIGHFGLGFYSAYMIADKVTVDTLSYKPDAQPVLWECDGSSDYEMGPGTRTERGTTIQLHVGKEHEEFLDEKKLKEVLHRYCNFLPYPIYLNGEQINTEEPLWVKAPSQCMDEEYRQFYRHLYPHEGDPLFWIHLNVDYPFHLKGILYFPKIARDFDLNKSGIQLYCNRVFVSDNCKDLVPDYLLVLKGVIDSPDIPLNVSRSYLQMDKTVRQLSTHIAKKVSDSLQALYKSDRDKYVTIWSDISLIVKLGMIQDEKFYERVRDVLIWKTVEGTWTTLDEYLERNRQKTGDKILYTEEHHHQEPLLTLYKEKGIEVLVAEPRIDPYLIQNLERKMTPVQFQRIDAGAIDALAEAESHPEVEQLTTLLKAHIPAGMEIEAKNLASSMLPAFLKMDESQRRLRDYMASLDTQGKGQFPDMVKKTLVVNTHHPLMNLLPKLAEKHPEVVEPVVHEMIDLSLLAQREMDPAALQTFIHRTHQMMEKLLTLGLQ